MDVILGDSIVVMYVMERN